jgi:membrane protein
MPNTRVKLKSAIIGAFVGSLFWSIAKWGYIYYAAHSAKAETFGKIYGGLAAIPTFLIWVDLNWIVILFGAHVSYADQNIKAFEAGKRNRRFRFFWNNQQ